MDRKFPAGLAVRSNLHTVILVGSVRELSVTCILGISVSTLNPQDVFLCISSGFTVLREMLSLNEPERGIRSAILFRGVESFGLGKR